MWDWNGTLLDDVALCFSILNTLLTRHGYAPIESLDAYRRVFCFPIAAYYQNAGFDFSRDPFEQLAEEYMRLYVPRSEGCALQPEAREVLQAFRQQGARQIILSASPLSILRQQVEQRGISPCFDTLLGLSDIYAHSKIEVGKAWIAASGAAPEDVVMVGDCVHDREVASAMGVSCVLFSRGHQPADVLCATGARVVDDLRALYTT